VKLTADEKESQQSLFDNCRQNDEIRIMHIIKYVLTTSFSIIFWLTFSMTQ